MTTRIVTDCYGHKHITNEPPFHPPQREWIDLTPEEIDYWIGSNTTKKALCRAIQSALKEKNHA